MVMTVTEVDSTAAGQVTAADSRAVPLAPPVNSVSMTVAGTENVKAFWNSRAPSTARWARYTCDAAGWMVIVDGLDGAIHRHGPLGWTSLPIRVTVSIDVADDDYLNYGFWLKRTTTDGATTYNEVETFAEAEPGIDRERPDCRCCRG